MKIAIIGTVGVPSCYGGYETLAENLVRYAELHAEFGAELTVYCSGRAYTERLTDFHGAQLRYSRLNANGAQSTLYDVLTSLNAVARRHDTLLFLGVSGAIVIPLLRLISRARIITNVDGIEWRRKKWRGFAKYFLRLSERLAVRYSHEIVADNQGIADYLRDAYGVVPTVIAYGGDHALQARLSASVADAELGAQLPERFALALCRIEPENNIEMILRAFEDSELPLVFVGNWERSEYGRSLRAQFIGYSSLHLFNPIYEPSTLHAIRSRASLYIHGHSAGGTNPSLVEMMHFGVPVLAHGCTYNRYSTEGRASYFETSEELSIKTRELSPEDATRMGADMRSIALRRYTWEIIGRSYFVLFQHAHWIGDAAASTNP